MSLHAARHDSASLGTAFHRVKFCVAALPLLLLGGLGGGTAAAHPEISPTTVNRYVTAALLGSQLEVSLSLLFGPLPAAEERQRIDQDGDGRIAPGEVEAAVSHWRMQSRSLFVAALAGARLSGDLSVDLNLNGDSRVGAHALVVQATLRTEVKRERLMLTLSPAGEVPRPGETELALMLAPDWRLIESQLAGEPQGGVTAFKLGASAGVQDVAGFSVEPVADTTSSVSTTPPLALVVGIGLALVVALVFAWRRAARR